VHAYAAPDADSATDRAFELLYRRYVKDVYRYTLAVLRNPSDAEDVTQTTFLNAYRAFQRGEQPLKPHHWLIKIAHNACRSRYVRIARRPVEVPFEESLAQVPAQPADVDVQALLAALGELPFRQRAAIVMRELDGRSYREIAETLEVTVPAVETLIFRARRRLRADHAAIRTLAVVPLPQSLGSFLGGGGAVAGAGGGALLGSGLAFKVVLMLAAGLVAGGVATDAFKATAAPPDAPKEAALRQPGRPAAQVRTAGSTRALLTGKRATSGPIAGVGARGRNAAMARARAANLPPGAAHLGTIWTAPRAGGGAPPGAGSAPAPAPSAAGPAAEPPAQAPSGGSAAGVPSAPTAPAVSTDPITSAVSTVTTTASQPATSPVPGVSVPSVPSPPDLVDPVTSLLPPPPPLPNLP
jgi:RNA polymerase sigma factor (sigma-70 family)